MIDPQDLDDVYTGGTDDFRPKINTPVGPGPKKPVIGFERPVQAIRQTDLAAVDMRTSDHQKFFGEMGTPNPNNTGYDLGLMMGNRQSVGNKLARRVGNLVPNIAAGLMDMVGSVGSLLTEFGDDKDYHNGLNEAADAIRNPFGESYARSNDTWAISDPSWWINHGFNVGEIATSFALGGAGAARVLGGAAKLMGGSQLAMEAAQIGTSALVSFAESAMAGSDVFKEVYNAQKLKLLAKGVDPGEAETQARHIAAQSASTTAQLGTILTMGLNVGAYGGLFKSQTEVAKDIISRRIAASEAQALGADASAQAIRGLNAADYMDKLIHHGGIKSILTEMNQEGWEEVFQQFAQVTGSEMGQEGDMKGFFEQFGELENLVDRTANSEGLLSFTLGAAFGGLQHALLNNVIPSKRVAKLDENGSPIPVYKEDGETIQPDKNGNPVVEKHWVTPRRYERDFTVQSFDTLKEAIASDYDKQVELESDYLKAVKDGKVVEAEAVRDKLFDPTRLHAIRNGMSEPWIRTFEEIGALDNTTLDDDGATEAMRRGYATSPGTDEHTQSAKKTIEGIKHLTNVYEALQQTYGTKYESNAHVKPFVDMVFARESDLYDTKQRIEKYEKILTEERKKENELASLTDPDSFSEAINNFNSQLMSAQETDKVLAKDQADLNSADPKKVQRLLKKYRAVGMGDGDTKEALTVLAKKLENARMGLNTKIKSAETQLFATPEYVTWLENNADKSFDDFVQEVNTRSGLTLQNHALATEIETARTNYNIAREHLREMTAEKNAQRFMKTVGAWQEKLRKEAEEVAKKNAARLAAMLKDKNATDRLNKIELNRIAEDYLGQAEELEEQVAENKERIKKAQKELDGLTGDWFRARALRSQIRKLEKENKKLEARILQLKSLYSKYVVEVEPVAEETDVDDVIDESEETEETVTYDSTEKDINDFLNFEIDEETDPNPEEEETLEDFDTLMDGLTNKSLKRKVNSIVKKLIDNKVEFSLDLLNNEIAKGWIDQAAAAKLLQAARKFADVTKALLAVESDPDPKLSEAQKQLEAEWKKEITELEQKLGPQLAELAKQRDAALDKGEKVSFAVNASINALSKSMLDQKKKINEKYQKLIADLKKTPPKPKPEIEVTGPDTPDTPPIDNSDPEDTAVPDGNAYHAGLKRTNALAGASSTIAYEEGTRRDKDGRLQYIKVTKPTELAPAASKLLLLPGSLEAGHEIRYEVDINYEGPKHITDSLSWDKDGNVVMAREKGSDYLDESGKVRTKPADVGDVPIRVVDAKTGELITYIPTMSWLTAKFPGTEDYRNFVEFIETSDGDVIELLEMEKIRLMELREMIVTQYNNTGTGMESEIDEGGKGTGRVIQNYVVESKDPETMDIKAKIVSQLAYNENDPESSLLPDESLELAIVIDKDGIPYTGDNFPTQHALGFDTKGLQKGFVGALIPAANGQMMYAPLIGRKLVTEGRKSVELQSVIRVIELHLLNDGTNPEVTKEIKALEKATKFNIAEASGLRSFINQYYTYLTGFQDAALSPNTKSANKEEQFLFNVNDFDLLDKTKRIKAGFSMRGDGAVYAKIENGKLNDDFIQVLTEGFKQRSRAVVFTNTKLKLKGINSLGKFVGASYTSKGWQHTEYKNYNQYVKSFSVTPVYGRNKLDGKYVYTANPIVPLAMPKKPGTLVEPSTTPSLPSGLPDIDMTETDQDDFDAMIMPSNNSLKVRVTKAIGTAPDNSKPLTEKTLRDLYNFTAEVERNGKTVLGVLHELTSRGHNFIPDGFNPFSRCL